MEDKVHRFGLGGIMDQGRWPDPCATLLFTRHVRDLSSVEKGIDVQLALAVAETILTGAADIAFLFTQHRLAPRS
jgi:hypothetical protein